MRSTIFERSRTRSTCVAGRPSPRKSHRRAPSCWKTTISAVSAAPRSFASRSATAAASRLSVPAVRFEDRPCRIAIPLSSSVSASCAQQSARDRMFLLSMPCIRGDV